MLFNKKEDRENIEKFNNLSGMSHRSKPYDLKKTEDIIEAVKMATAEYADMSHYWTSLDSLVSAFDESIEYYEPAAWLKIGLMGDTGDEELEDARVDLDNAADSFRLLMDRAEEKCISMWRIVLTSENDEVKKYFFGDAITVDEELLEEVFENDFFEIIDSINYDGIIEHSASNFAKEFKKTLLQAKNKK